MKTLFNSAITSFALACVSIYGNTIIATIKNKNAHSHHISFGPEAFYFDIHTHVKDILINDCKFFIGMKAQYEYVKPKAFYAGVDILSAGTKNGFRASYHGHHFTTATGITGFGHFEMRFGYTFAPNEWLLSPYLGVGGYSIQLGRHASFGFKEVFLYPAFGLRSAYNMTENFYTGCNFKIFFTDDSYKRYGHGFTDHAAIKRTEHSDMWGGEIGALVGWRLGTRKRWDIQIEPYFTKLNFAEVQNIYGTRLMFGCRF